MQNTVNLILEKGEEKTSLPFPSLDSTHSLILSLWFSFFKKGKGSTRDVRTFTFHFHRQCVQCVCGKAFVVQFCRCGERRERKQGSSRAVDQKQNLRQKRKICK